MTGAAWDQLADAYRSGRTRLDPARDLFAEEVDLLVSQHLDRHDQAMVAVVTSACERALRAARVGSTATATGHLRRASDALDSPSVSADCRALGRSQHHAVLAYLRYRCGDRSGAEAALHEAMALDAGLCATGYRVLEVHRVQLGHNLARIRGRNGDLSGAVDLLAALLAYLRGIGPWPLDDAASPDALADSPPALLQAMDRQLAGELGLLIARHDDDSHAGELATFVLASLDERLGAADPTGCGSSTDLWRTLLVARRAGDGFAAGRATAELLGRGPRGSGLLWYLVALDVLTSVCRVATIDPTARRLADTLEEDLRRRGRVPQSVAAAHRATRAGSRS